MELMHIMVLFLVLYLLSCITGKQRYSSDVYLTIAVRQVKYQYVYDIFKKNHRPEEVCIPHDPLFHPLTYVLKQNMKWNHRSVCSNDTFVLLMYFTYNGDSERRDLIREYVKQGMVVDGRVINYVQIVATNDTEQLRHFDQDNALYGDLLVSLHKDVREEWPLTVFDAYMWARDYCGQAKYVVKVDGDVWVHLGNLIHYLQSAPSHAYYGGQTVRTWVRKGRHYKGVRYSPNDCPEHPNVFNLGGGNIMSSDLIPFINIGMQYLDYIMPAVEDMPIGYVLQKAGVSASGTPGYRALLFYEKLPNGTVPKNVLFLHCRGLDVIKGVYRRLSNKQQTALL